MDGQHPLDGDSRGGSESSDPATGKVVEIQTASRDASERKRAEEALREAQKRFRLTFEHAPIGMAELALDGRFLRVNRALREMTGYSEEELLARDFLSITHPDDAPSARDRLRGDRWGTSGVAVVESATSTRTATWCG